MDPKRYIAYYRVSTAQQGRSGLGLEAQQASVAAFLKGHNHELVAEFVEIESGRNTERPKLHEALAAARRHHATLVIAKLDRLARNVAFVAGLLESNVEFIAADMPTANRMVLQMMAVVAEHEGRMISERTKAALAAAKARGVRLGGPNLREAQAIARKVIMAQADEHAGTVLPALRQIATSGVRSLHTAADRLNQQGAKTARGGRWHGTTVSNMLARSGFESLTELAVKG